MGYNHGAITSALQRPNEPGSDCQISLEKTVASPGSNNEPKLELKINSDGHFLSIKTIK